MTRRRVFSIAVILLVLGFAAGRAAAQDLSPVKLPAPQIEGGRPLMQVLNARHSSREFDVTKAIPDQVLSNLLWAAFGVNRPDGGRTAPSAMNWQEIDVYAFLARGTYIYRAKDNALVPVAGTGDLRAATGGQPFVGSVPLDLVYIADTAKAKAAPEQVNVWSPAHAGFIAQNVYLFCASEGLNTVVRGMIDKPALAEKLHLRPEQKIWLAQSVGYPPAR
jgi:nitroreductase